MTQRETILKLLAGGPKTTGEVGEATGIGGKNGPGAVLYLARLAGLVERDFVKVTRRAHSGGAMCTFKVARWWLKGAMPKYPISRKYKPFTWVPA